MENKWKRINPCKKKLKKAVFPVIEENTYMVKVIIYAYICFSKIHARRLFQPCADFYWEDASSCR